MRTGLVHVLLHREMDLRSGIEAASKYPGSRTLLVAVDRSPLSVGPALMNTLTAGRLVQELTALLGGKGGGRPDLARGVGN